MRGENVNDWRSSSRAAFAVRFFLAATAVLFVAGGLARLLVGLGHGRPESPHFPPVFWLSTLLLVCGSLSLQRSLTLVRRERQRSFRRSLLLALAAGVLFVGVQCYGLWWLVGSQEPDASTGVNAFLVVLVALHGMHFTVALLFLVFVTLNALANRYDHEYWWGVTVCAGFWHVLGVMWLVIMGVFAIALGHI